MRRVIVIAVLIIISFVLQTTLFNYHDVVGVAPDLLLVITMSFGIMRGRREGLLTGFFCGEVRPKSQSFVQGHLDLNRYI